MQGPHFDVFLKTMFHDGLNPMNMMPYSQQLSFAQGPQFQSASYPTTSLPDSETTPSLETEGDSLDFDASPQDVIHRIETCALWLVQQTSLGSLPNLPLTQSSFPSQQSANIRSLLGRHAESADRYARLWAVLNVCHELLLSGTRAAQRDLHYRLKPLEIFSSDQRHLLEAIQDAVLLLRVPRSALGIICSSKGLVAGPLLTHDISLGVTLDAATSPTGTALPGDVNAIINMQFSTSARYVLVIEKETVFQQLLGDPLLRNSRDIILVTGKGVPDIATRAFLAALHAACPSLVLFGLVDWNPCGLMILSTYKFGSRRMVESSRYCLPPLCWLGVRSNTLSAASPESFHALTDRDKAMMPGLRSQLMSVGAMAWVGELDAMEAADAKADIEAAYTAVPGGAAAMAASLVAAIERGEYI
jgi:meiotic recombination protein SPO11